MINREKKFSDEMSTATAGAITGAPPATILCMHVATMRHACGKHMSNPRVSSTASCITAASRVVHHNAAVAAAVCDALSNF